MLDAEHVALSKWLQAARPIDGGLFVPGRSKRRGCDLLLTPEGVRVSANEIVTDLPYEHWAAGDPDMWVIVPWAYTRGGGDIGVALHGTGRYAAPIAALRKRRRSWIGALTRQGVRRDVAPLVAAHVVNFRTDADSDALSVLCWVLAHRPDWRPQLADPQRVTEFLHDLSTQGHGRLVEKTGLRRRSMETFIVMKKLGYEHLIGGRPLPDESRPDGDVVVQAVLEGLSDNRYALPPVRETVSELVHRHYLDVTPWPFAALLPANHTDGAPPVS
jgi:hypothetical protein